MSSQGACHLDKVHGDSLSSGLTLIVQTRKAHPCHQKLAPPPAENARGPLKSGDSPARGRQVPRCVHGVHNVSFTKRTKPAEPRDRGTGPRCVLSLYYRHVPWAVFSEERGISHKRKSTFSPRNVPITDRSLARLVPVGGTGALGAQAYAAFGFRSFWSGRRPGPSSFSAALGRRGAALLVRHLQSQHMCPQAVPAPHPGSHRGDDFWSPSCPRLP